MDVQREATLSVTLQGRLLKCMKVQVDVRNKGDEAEGSEENRIVDSLMQFQYPGNKDERK